MAETSNLLSLVKSISSHLHSAHGDHLCVHVNHLLLGELKLQRRLLKFVNLKGRLWESDLDFLRSIRGRSKEAGSSGREGTLAKGEEEIRRLWYKRCKNANYIVYICSWYIMIAFNIQQERMPWEQFEHWPTSEMRWSEAWWRKKKGWREAGSQVKKIFFSDSVREGFCLSPEPQDDWLPLNFILGQTRIWSLPAATLHLTRNTPQ